MLRLAWIILTAVPALLAGPVVVPDSSTTPAPPQVTSIDCSNRDNGFYSIGCTQNFTECHLKKTYNKVCPTHLHFHSRLGRCEYKVDIPECKNPSQSAGKIFASPPEFKCENRTDGFYSHPNIPCDKSYYVCLKGHVMRMACGYQQFYDVVKQRCEFKSRVPACKGKQISGVLSSSYTVPQESEQTQAPAAPPQIPYGQQTFSQDQAAPPAPPPAEVTSNKVTPDVQPHEGAPDCASLADGVFADTKIACSRFFWKCAHKTLFKYECPAGLFYDKDVNRCDHKKFVPMCGGTRPATTPTPPARDSVPVDFDCSGKTDGYYVKNRCDSTFYTCLAGTVQRLSCADNLSFDDRVNYCDYPLACQQERPETTRPPMDQTYNIMQSDATAAPMPSIDFSCDGKNDGRFALGKCFNDYVVCTNGQPMKMSCPASLLFDGEHCNFKDACLSPPSTTPAADIPSSPYGSMPQIPQDTPSTPLPPVYNPVPTVPARTTTAPPAYAQTLPVRSEPQAGDVNCANLENGPQASERCTGNYVVCDNGKAVRQSCPHDLIYNPYEKYCDYKDSVKGCGNGKNVGQDVPLIAVPASTAAPQLANPYRQAKPSQDKPADKCATVADGIYAEGCSSYYIQCLSGISYKQDCPDGLFYNRKSGICDHKHRVRACGGKEETRPAPTQSLPADVPAYGVMPANDQPQVSIGNQCTESSIENSGCKTFYFQCVFGKIARIQCAPSLYYNPDEHICDWKKNIVACGGVAPTVPAAADEAVQPYTQKTGTIENQDSEADNFCMSKENGFYAAGCQTFGYACVVGSTKKFKCPGGTYFNPDNNKCEWKENVPVCGGTPSPTTAAPAQSPPAASAGGYGNLPVAEGAGAPAADIPLKPFCERLSDGYYADGCNSFFYYCNSGVTQRLNCPAGTFYHIRKKDCHRREDVPACNGEKLTEVTQQPAQSSAASSSPYGSPPQQSPPSQSMFDCKGKQDGLYDLPECTPIFIQCYNQAVVKQTCQEGLFYNKENGMCDYRENVPACGGRIPVTTTTTTTPAPVQQTPATARPYPAAAIAADTPLDASCSGKEDGYYADGCTSRYYSCQGGNIAQHSCQHNLRFDQIRLRCDFDENIEACGGKTPEEDTPATTAAPYGSRQPIQQDTSKTTFDCRGKKDGLYPLSPCNKDYIACSNERVFNRQCSNGLFYDDDKKFCDYSSRVAGCGAQPSQPAQSPALPSQPYGSVATPAPTLPSRDEPSFDCSGKTDGFYETATKCSKHYVQCSSQIAYNGKCPEGLVFNTASGLCDYTASTAGCPNYVPATTQAPTQPPQQPLPTQPLPTQPAQSPPQQPLPTQPLPTQPAQSQPQYPGLPQTLPAQSQPVQTSQTTLPSQSAQSQPNYQPQQSPQTQEFSCSGQPDGIYGSVCGTQYWKCSGGMTFPQKCSPNTVFDGVSGGCDFSAKIAACQNNGI